MLASLMAISVSESGGGDIHESGSVAVRPSYWLRHHLPLARRYTSIATIFCRAPRPLFRGIPQLPDTAWPTAPTLGSEAAHPEGTSGSRAHTPRMQSPPEMGEVGSTECIA